MGNRVYFFIAIALCALGFVAFGLSFSLLGIYALISSILLGIASLSFLAVQKKKGNFSAVKYVKIAAYVELAISVALFAGGLIYSLFV